MITVGVIGYGYWGPNIVRNFAELPDARIAWVTDLRPERLAQVRARYSSTNVGTDHNDIITDPSVDAVVIATPVRTHFELGMAALRAGKHVWMEKPLAATSEEAARLLDEADRRGLALMVDHTFVFTPAVQKMRDLTRGGELGDIQYYDSVRINLGLFQPDFNVLWDLAPHDLTIMDFVLSQTLGTRARWVSAIGTSHYGRHENLAYVTVGFDEGLLAHVHVNWVAPVKTRRTIIAGDKKMIVWDDTSPVEPVKVYESSVDVEHIDKESAYALNVQYRSGDVHSPKLDGKEALTTMAQTFAAACLDGAPSPSDASVGVRIVRMLDAAQKSLDQHGARIEL
jgi:predicted dehydrogenase